MGNISDSDIPPAKAQRRQVREKIFLKTFAAFASLREIFRHLVAALPRWALWGECNISEAVTLFEATRGVFS
jgi:hypothetical protein